MPDNTVKVDRSTPWGNPFITGSSGTQAECADLFLKLMTGYICLSDPNVPAATQEIYLRRARENLHQLRGRNLACWCRPGTPCHADILMALANQ